MPLDYFKDKEVRYLFIFDIISHFVDLFSNLEKKKKYRTTSNLNKFQITPQLTKLNEDYNQRKYEKKLIIILFLC